MSLDEWIEAHPPIKELQEELFCNIDAMTDLPYDEKTYLTRLHMIMIRQWMEKYVPINLFSGEIY